jgi:hypothetical protein
MDRTGSLQRQNRPLLRLPWRDLEDADGEGDLRDLSCDRPLPGVCDLSRRTFRSLGWDERKRSTPISAPTRHQTVTGATRHNPTETGRLPLPRVSHSPTTMKPRPAVPTVHHLPHPEHEQKPRLVRLDRVDGPRPGMQHHHQPSPPSTTTGLPHTEHTQQLKH